MWSNLFTFFQCTHHPPQLPIHAYRTSPLSLWHIFALCLIQSLEPSLEAINQNSYFGRGQSKTLSCALLADCSRTWSRLKAFNSQHTLLSRVNPVDCQENLHIISKTDGWFAKATNLTGLEICYVYLSASRFPIRICISFVSVPTLPMASLVSGFIQPFPWRFILSYVFKCNYYY
jgi:hypothetical protein